MRAAVLFLAVAVAVAFTLVGCGESASTYDPKSGHYVSTEQYKKDHGVDEVCQTASCWDDKSGHFISGDEWNKRREERGK